MRSTRIPEANKDAEGDKGPATGDAENAWAWLCVAAFAAFMAFCAIRSKKADNN